MKKYISILILCLSVLTTTYAQHTVPRTGVGANKDNTFRAMTINFQTRVDSVAGDTLKLNPNAYRTYVSIPALVDSINITIPSVATSYYGDEITISAINTSTGVDLRFTGANIRTSTALPGRLNIAASKSASITFMFNGVLWDEKGRSTNP